MTIRITELQTRDHAKVVEFAMVGMNFDLYVYNPTLRRLYTRYFWLSELAKATRAYAAYQGQRLLGVMLVGVEGESPRPRAAPSASLLPRQRCCRTPSTQ